MKLRSAFPALVSFLLLGSGAARAADPSSAWLMNPAPAEKFAAFTHFELAPIAMNAPYAGKAANVKALAKIQQEFSLKADALVASWNASGSAAQPARTLVIQPVVDEIRYISGSKRFWAGGLPGDSFVRITVRFTDKGTGTVIATPMFYAKANAIGGGWSIGGTDNAMLTRIADHMAEYLNANYNAAMGGPTGVDAPKK